MLQAYQDAEIESQPFKLRLIELVAVSTHQIAVLLFQLQPKLHAGDVDAVVSWKEEARWVELEGGRRIYREPLKPRPTLFFHVDYMDYDQYPSGLADVAWYWAEDRIFGGIVLFDRGESGYEVSELRLHDPSSPCLNTTRLVSRSLLSLREKAHHLPRLAITGFPARRLHRLPPLHRARPAIALPDSRLRRQPPPPRPLGCYRSPPCVPRPLGAQVRSNKTPRHPECPQRWRLSRAGSHVHATCRSQPRS